jgi:exopolysaccharide biosynthesis protein
MFTDGEVVADDMSYHSSDLSVEIEVVEVGESVAYVAEVYFREMDNFKPVFAGGKMGGGYATVSEFAEAYDAVFAINSDSCTAVDYGLIIRYGEVLRDDVAADHLAIYSDGSMKSLYQHNISSKQALKDGAVHVFNFGPMLYFDSKPIEYFRYSHIRTAHPRTAIGMIEPYHYYFVVVDGRSDYSKGMTLEELSSFMYSLGCVDAYNLDGGGSSTMVFQGTLINKPLGGSEERELDSAIVFVEGK